VSGFVNRRGPEQWQIISQAIDFRDLLVADLGCGHGDLLLKMREAGAVIVDGVDHDPEIVKTTRARCEGNGISIHEEDLLEWLDKRLRYDLILCFSVLPYMPSMHRTLKAIHAHSRRALIECQYRGDGPGKVRDDAEMLWHLKHYWDRVRKIGATVVEYRNMERSIWLCEGSLQKGDTDE